MCPVCDRHQHVVRDGDRWALATHPSWSSIVSGDCDSAGIDALPLVRSWLATELAQQGWRVAAERRAVVKALREIDAAERNAAYVRRTHPQLVALVPPETRRPALSTAQHEALAAFVRAEDERPPELLAPEPPPMAPEDLARLKALGLVERSLLGHDGVTVTGRAWLAAEAGAGSAAEAPADPHRHPARAVVAFGPHRSASFLFYEGRVLAETIEVEWELDPREVLPSASIARFLEGAVGVVVWEGEYRWSEPGCEETHGEWEVTGRCRPLSAEEWIAVGAGVAPWALAERV